MFSASSPIALAAGSTGGAAAKVFGGNGPDTLGLTFTHDLLDSPSINGTVFGGNGPDTITSSTDVVVVK